VNCREYARPGPGPGRSPPRTRDRAPDFRVSKGTSSAKDAGGFFGYGDYTQAAFQSHLFYPAWTDNSNSTGTNPDGTLHQMDLYTALVPIP